jgi:hypothetical protein
VPLIAQIVFVLSCDGDLRELFKLKLLSFDRAIEMFPRNAFLDLIHAVLSLGCGVKTPSDVMENATEPCQLALLQLRPVLLAEEVNASASFEPEWIWQYDDGRFVESFAV